MKRYITLLLFLAPVCMLAQTPLTPAEKDMAKTLRGARFSIEASKTILSAGEKSSLEIDVFIPPVIDQESGEPKTDGSRIAMADYVSTLGKTGVQAPYTAKNWRILAGGGRLDISDDFDAVYTAPNSAPPGYTMTISVELIPTSSYFPKVELLQTLYFENGDNIFTFNVPASDIKDERYSEPTGNTVTGATGGAPGLSSMDPRALAALPASERKKLEDAMSKVKAAQMSSNVNVMSLTSNANAIYDANNNVTIIKFLGLAKDTHYGSSNANTVTTPGIPSTVLVITYTGGLTKGVHPFNGSLNSVAFNLTTDPHKNCACSMKGNNSVQKLNCGGTITITSIDKDFIKGTISTTVWNNHSGQDKYFNRGTLYGVFKVRKASF